MNEEFVVEEVEIQPDPERVIEGLRDTGYSFNTAMADILDNSIAANATKVFIHIESDPNRTLTVTIADDGCGMNQLELQNAMRYGSSRRNSPDSLGKFGLGLKTASTSFCRSLSLISRSREDDQYRKIQWDLDYVAQSGKWLTKLLQPTEDEIDYLQEAAGDSHGTLVSWEKIDRLFTREYKTQSAYNKHLTKLIDELKFHLSMTFQRFLDKEFTSAANIDICVNGEFLQPWDPFKFGRKLLDEPMDIEFGEGEDGTVARLEHRAYCLPRYEELASKEDRKYAKISNETQGFYIYRENRLIHNGGWLGLFTLEPHYSLLRVELSFDHQLDEILHIDIKKSRILMHDYLADAIKNCLKPARKAATDSYREGQKQRVKARAQDTHQASNNNIEGKAAEVEQSSVKPLNSNEAEIKNKLGTVVSKFKIRQEQKKGELRVVPVSSIESGYLWSPCLVDGRHAIELNTSHPYYQKIYFPLRENSAIVTGMDALLWAMAEAEVSNFNEQTRQQYEDMRNDVSRILTRLIADLPEPDVADETGEND